MQQVRILCLLPIYILFHGKSLATTPPNSEKVYKCFWQVVEKLFNSHGDMVHHFIKRLLFVSSVTVLNWVQWRTNVQMHQVRIIYLLPIYILFPGKGLATTPPNREKVYQCFWQVLEKLHNSHGDVVHRFNKRLLSINPIRNLNWVYWSTNVQIQQGRILCLLPIYILFHGKCLAKTPPNCEKLYRCFQQVVEKLCNSHGDTVYHFIKRFLSINSVTILNWIQWSTNVQMQQVGIL